MRTINLSHRRRSNNASPIKFIFFKLAGAKGGSREIDLRMTKSMNDAKYRGCLYDRCQCMRNSIGWRFIALKSV